MTEVLVVDDEPAIVESVEYALRKAGYSVRQAGSLASARRQLSADTSLIVLDLMLPDGSGFDFLQEVTAPASPGVAVIVLSSRDGETDRIRALEMGADDYVTKPFSPREVVARVSAVLRRLESRRSDAPAALVPLHADPHTRRATVHGRALELTRVEFDLLLLFQTKPGQVFSRATIINEVWGEGFALSDRTIDSHIKALRRKISELGGTAEWIETVRGVGYRLIEGELSS